VTLLPPSDQTLVDQIAELDTRLAEQTRRRLYELLTAVDAATRQRDGAEIAARFAEADRDHALAQLDEQRRTP
jgi:hypothetical protein